MHLDNILNIAWFRKLSFFKCILPVRNLFILFGEIEDPETLSFSDY